MSCTTLTFLNDQKGKICTFWRLLADRAVADGNDFFCLLGDDVEVRTEFWIEQVLTEFHLLQHELNLPDQLFGFGCIALHDEQAPGFPTFPVLHKMHYKVNKELFDGSFVNQDADPFLFQLYRRWGAARFTRKVSLVNRGRQLCTSALRACTRGLESWLTICCSGAHFRKPDEGISGQASGSVHNYRCRGSDVPSQP